MAFEDELDADLRRRAERAFEAFGAEVAADLRQLVSVQYPPPSRAGEPPHRRKGGYQASIKNAVDVEADRIIASVYTGLRLGVWLEKGTPRMAPRPHFDVIFERWAPLAAGRIGDLMFGPGS